MTCENLHIGFCRSIPDLYRMIVEAKGDALTLLNGRYGTIWSIFPVHKSSAFFSSPTVVDDHCSAKPRLIREKRRGLLEVHQKRIQGDLTVIEETREIVLCLSVRGGNTPQRLSLSLERIDPVEALEEMGQVRGFDARSLVDDLQASVTGLSVQFHLDLFANASTVCDRVFQEIDAELRQVEAISPDHELVQARQVDLDGVLLCQRGEVFRCIDDDLTEIDSFAFEHGLPVIGAGQDQQVTDQPGHALF